MHFKFPLTVLFCLAAFCTAASAQSELDTYQGLAAERSILFRGKQAERYSARANGHPYWETVEYVQGDLVCEGKLYRDMYLNIDAFAQRVLVRLPSNMLAVELSAEQVPYIGFNGRRFTGLGPDDGRLPEGIYEIFGDGDYQVWKHVSKRLRSGTGNVNGDPIGYYDQNYNPSFTDYFGIDKTYYFKDEHGNFTQFKGKGALLRKFGPRKKEIRKAVRDAGFNLPGISFDNYCKGVLTVANQ